jgi:probable DNA metabolism protein
LEKKEMAMLRFLILGFQLGACVANCLADPVVDRMLQAEKHLLGEAHLLSGFIRFADYEGRLFASIRPKNFVLPLLAPHFADRYALEAFLIYDRTHGIALAYEKGRAELCELAGILPEISDTERFYQALWKQFYHTIGIEARANARCRRTHLPQRYWENMVEMKDFLNPEGKREPLHILREEGRGLYAGDSVST